MNGGHTDVTVQDGYSGYGFFGGYVGITDMRRDAPNAEASGGFTPKYHGPVVFDYESIKRALDLIEGKG